MGLIPSHIIGEANMPSGKMNILKKYSILPTVLAILIMALGSIASAQDPGQPDSMIVGNLDGSIFMTDIGRQISIPIWVKTDDSVTFMHIPLASENTYITSRSGGVLYQPLNLWDDIEFMSPNNNSPMQGWTSQSLLGYAFTSPPRDPQNFLYTNYEWVHVADFLLNVSSNPDVYGDTTCLMEGRSPYYGFLTWQLQDGVTQFAPQTVYTCITFLSNIPPVIGQPADGAAFDINQEFPIVVNVIATDGDNDNINLTVSAPFSGYTFTDIQTYPGYTHKRFRWIPQPQHSGSFDVAFTADDGSGGIDVNTITLNVSPTLLSIPQVPVLLGSEIIMPISLDNYGLTSYVGGFEMLLQYDEPMLCLTGVTRTNRLSGWDYFNYNIGDTSTVRIVGLADVTGSGEYLVPGSGPIVDLHFTVTDDDLYLDQFAWIHFICGDDNDNTISDTTGYLLVSPALEDGWIHVVDPEDILVADINLNTIAWEIADAVLFANYLVNPDEFPLSPVQMLATDMNGDHALGTLADLIYLLNVLQGELPPPRVSYGLDIAAVITLNEQAMPDGRYSVEYDSDIPAGGVLVRIDHRGSDLGEVVPATDLRMQTVDKDGILSVLIYDFDGNYINPGSRLFELEIISGEFNPSFSEIQVSDRYGNVVPSDGFVALNLPVAYRLLGAYPNPFNSSTAIGFSLPEPSDVELTIYNVLGQQVRSLKHRNVSAGEGSIIWDGTSDSGHPVASGVYMYRLAAGDFAASSRMVLLK